MQNLQLTNASVPTAFPSETEWKIMKEQAGLLVRTGFLPKAVRTPEQAIAIMLKGRELNIGPMLAFSHIAIIEGKPTISPELMLNLVFKAYPQTKINYQTLTDTACKIEVIRPGQKANYFSWTMDDAKKAGLAGKYNWKNYPRAMLRSRCISEMGRSLFPDAIAGCSYTPEELGATTNEDQTQILAPAHKPAAPQLPDAKQRPVTRPQLTRMFAIAGEHELPGEAIKAYMAENFKIDTSTKLNNDQYGQLVTWIRQQPLKPKKEEVAETAPEPESNGEIVDASVEDEDTQQADTAEQTGQEN